MRRRTPLALPALLALTVSLLSSSAARADDADEVVVRGRSAGGFVSRASIEDAPREITDAASLIEPLPGVHVRRLGADDSFASLSIRGTGSTQVAVYLAGVPLSGGADPTLDLATLPLWPGAGARVFRSFAPAALGRGSLGGTLVLDTPSPRAPQSTEVWAAAGSFGSRRLRVGDVRGEPDGVRIATAFSASRSDDDFSYLDPAATIRNGHDVYATRNNAGHVGANALASIAIPVRLGPSLERTENNGALTVTTLAQIRRQELPGTISNPTRFQRLDSNRLLAALELTLPAGSGAFGVRGWGRREGLMVHDSAADPQFTQGPTSTDDAILATGASLGWRGRPTEATTLEARVDGSAERFMPGTWIGATQPPGARRTNAGVAVDATLRATPALTLAASARGDAWFDTSDEKPDTGTASELRPTGNLGAELVLGPVTLATHGGVLARPPSFVERFGNRGSFIGDPLLKPESATTVDAGASFTKKLGPTRLHLEAAAFATFAEDLIVFVPQGAYGLAKAVNIGRGRILGTEAEARASAYGIELRLSHTALATANESECRFVGGFCERPPLPGRPEHDFVGDLSYTVGPVRVRYGIDVVTGIFADNIGSTVVPDRVLHSTGARLQVPGAPGLSLSLDVRNLFDLRVAEYAGVGILGSPVLVRAPIGDALDYPIPGRRILFSARWVFPEPGASASFRGPK
ncbi:MAG: TonB-dependent receptor [Myxococcaceae bacterium]|nr:TonB-dependent receptor [Myxococcaceae bacterium]